MNLTEVIDSLNKQFNKRFAKKFADLNKNVYPTAKNDRGSYEVPVPSVGKGGGTIVIGPKEAFKLEPPAPVSVQFKNMKEHLIVYRLAYPYGECEIAAEKPEYFNYLFDSTIDKAIGNYFVTVGGPDIVRFGEVYCNYKLPGTTDSVFRQTEDELSLEIRLRGSWASDTEDYT